MHELGLDVQSAMDYVGDLIKSAIDTYIHNKTLVPSFGNANLDGEVAMYISGLQDSVIGTIHWSFDSERYFGSEHKQVKRDRIVTLMPGLGLGLTPSGCLRSGSIGAGSKGRSVREEVRVPNPARTRGE